MRKLPPLIMAEDNRERLNIMEQYTGKYDSSIYSKEALVKAAFSFIDDYYVHLEQSDGLFFVRLTPKKQPGDKEIISKFENELLSASVRLHVYEETHVLREIMLARAMASTMILDDKAYDNAFKSEDETANEQLSSILEDWFSHESN